ncbi:hypothetical protein NDU88_002937 [Pleurodeles waltl]|uniref:Uncharacterized protein n=1 Tax=Pleurodeles waltl TaxID=8319 RepID=A0AAV7QAA6_PLEWA|nr:hypothetical protein NDU88_002937 [Pleurodeles waltl]
MKIYIGACLRKQRCQTRSPRAPAGPSFIRTSRVLLRGEGGGVCRVGRTAPVHAELTGCGGAAAPGTPEGEQGAQVTAARSAPRAASRRRPRRELTLVGGPPGAGGGPPGAEPEDSGKEWTPGWSPGGLGRARWCPPPPMSGGAR